MRLILNGGGHGENLYHSYELFTRELKGKKVLYIPLAWENGNMENCINWLKGELLPFGVCDIVDVLLPNEITKDKFNDIGGVFIGGGNTFKLLKMLKESQGFDLLKDYLDNDGLIMGGSAGTLIFGKSIDTALKTKYPVSSTDENLVNLKDTLGFNKVRDFSLMVHYHKVASEYKNTKININNLLNTGHKLICIPEETSLWINDNTIQVIGLKPVEVFEKGNKSKLVLPNEFL
ncbi:MAG: Type 1 glutamine amidotransferase-like domain-containing protein [Clostridia bacterium]|nr:Type 1 glutamine amidotransferase-like domain-containing protein [Clostridia bacterium]